MKEQLRRANVNDTQKMSLLCEVKGKCPLCSDDLVTKKNSKNIRVFDVAHIYPLNPRQDEVLLLKDAEKITEDTDTEENFIPLCKKCHKIYDTHKTLEEYLQLVEIKKNILKTKRLEKIWDKQTLHNDIIQIAEKISSLKREDIEETKLSHKALKISEKKDETLDLTTEIKVAEYVKSFYVPIKESFKLLEKEEKAKSTFIFSQVKSYYSLLLLEDFDQNKIFEKMCEWFMNKTGILDHSKAEVLVSFFIQNCEVFS